MGDVARSDGKTVQGNTAVLHKVKIYFQIYPGIGGTMKHRCIPGVEYKAKAGNTVFGGLTDEDGSIQLFMAAGETAELEVFDTVYSITLKTDSLPDATKGVKERLSILGYYTGAINETVDGETDLAVLNFQADVSFNANGFSNGTVESGTKDKLKIQIGEK